MGFVLRTVFWLGLALVLLPPEARLGGADGRDGATIDVRDIDMGLAVHDATYAVWHFGTEIASTCDTNPKLCDAGMNLWKATVSATEDIAGEVANRWQAAPSAPVEVAEINPKRPKKIQARVE